jgi:hypothetical protein
MLKEVHPLYGQQKILEMENGLSKQIMDYILQDAINVFMDLGRQPHLLFFICQKVILHIIGLLLGDCQLVKLAYKLIQENI